MKVATNETSDAKGMNHQRSSSSEARAEKMFSLNCVSIEFPSEATLQNVPPEQPNSQVQVAVDRDGVTYSISELDAPSVFNQLNRQERQVAFEVARTIFLKGDNVLHCRVMEVKGFLGLDILQQDSNERIRKQMFVIGKKLYLLKAVTKGNFSDQIEQFFNSFQINSGAVSSPDQ